MSDKNLYNVICLSNQLWDFPYWTNKRHVMLRLAKLGHAVLYVDPPINMGRLFFRQLKRKKWPLKRLFTAQYKDVETDARIYSPLDMLPFSNITSLLHVIKIMFIYLFSFEKGRKTVLWVYHVEIGGLANYLKWLKYDVLIYDCVDNYVGFPKYDTPEKKEKINRQEEMLARKADIVFATAPGLVEKMKKYNSNVFYTPNVGDYEKFKNVRKMRNNLPPDLASIPRPRVGFTGSVDPYKFDKDLVLKVAKDHPKFSFVIIGPIALKDREASVDELGFGVVNNVHFLGSRPFSEIHEYYAGFDAFIIPYQLNEYTVGGCFPIKFHDALAAGLPVIVTDLPAYAPFKDVCYISKNNEEFSKNIKSALEEDNLSKLRDRQNVAKENSWDSKVSKMLECVSDYLFSRTKVEPVVTGSS